MRVRRAVIAALASLLLLTPAPVQALTFGELDGNGHPNVGSMVVVWPDFAWQVCSGTLRLTARQADSERGSIAA